MGRWPGQSLHLRCPPISATDGRQERQVSGLLLGRGEVTWQKISREELHMTGDLLKKLLDVYILLMDEPLFSFPSCILIVFLIIISCFSRSCRCRFISLYKGPCHTHKVQRLNESTSYTFRIQAFNEAGEGPFSTVYTFTTPRSPPTPVKGMATSCFQLSLNLNGL